MDEVSSPSPEEVQRTASALGDPSRFAIFLHIYESSAPVAVAELTELMGFNHNAIRQHLAQLLESGLIFEETEVRDRPGRPRKLYRAREDALVPVGESSRSYQRIARLLLEVAQSGDCLLYTSDAADE